MLRGPWTKDLDDNFSSPMAHFETATSGPSYEAAITKGDTMRDPSDGIRIGIMVNDGEICGKLPTEYVRSHTHLAY